MDLTLSSKRQVAAYTNCLLTWCSTGRITRSTIGGQPPNTALQMREEQGLRCLIDSLGTYTLSMWVSAGADRKQWSKVHHSFALRGYLSEAFA